uniref:Uncharacterized protein n=1 Tax=Knipowitschia caucasica TaxID=637954 RepID=A0AAV2KVL3_KNICA
MEELELIRCDSLDTASLSDQDLPLTLGSEALELPAGPEPSPTELAQCEAEVGTLLTIIAELNKKMGSLKAPSDPGGVRASAVSRPLVPDLLSHRLKQPERTRLESASSKPAFMDQGAVWCRLQDVLSSVEESVSFRRSWAAPITAVDLNKHREHLRAAQRSSAKASQILEDMEREFGISCTTVTKEENSRQNQQEVLERAHCVSLMEEDRDKLVNLHRVWRSGPHSPSYRPRVGSSSGSMSPDWASPPYPGSPLPQRRATRGPASLCGTRDSGNIPCSSPVDPEVETDRLNRFEEISILLLFSEPGLEAAV